MIIKRIRAVLAAAGAALLGLGGIGAPGPLITPPMPAHPVIRGRADDHDDQPHGPELEWDGIAGPDTEIDERHVLVLDHPRYGVLNGRNYIGYCEECPVADMGTGLTCGGPCPGEVARRRSAPGPVLDGAGRLAAMARRLSGEHDDDIVDDAPGSRSC